MRSPEILLALFQVCKRAATHVYVQFWCFVALVLICCAKKLFKQFAQIPMAGCHIYVVMRWNTMATLVRIHCRMCYTKNPSSRISRVWTRSSSPLEKLPSGAVFALFFARLCKAKCCEFSRKKRKKGESGPQKCSYGSTWEQVKSQNKDLCVLVCGRPPTASSSEEFPMAFGVRSYVWRRRWFACEKF